MSRPVQAELLQAPAALERACNPMRLPVDAGGTSGPDAGGLLHPVQVTGAARGWCLVSLTGRLVCVGGLLGVATALLNPAGPGRLMLLIAGLAVSVLGALVARLVAAWAWADLPAPPTAVLVPVGMDRCFAAAAAGLISTGAAAVCRLEPNGGLLAALFGVAAGGAAWDSVRQLRGQAAQPTRRVPALLLATAVCWFMAVRWGGLGWRELVAICAAWTLGAAALVLAGSAGRAVRRGSAGCRR